jgi:hypothetical protein
MPTDDVPGPIGEATLVALASSTNDLTLKESAIIVLLRRAKDGPEFQALSRLVEPAISQLMNAKPVLRQPFMFAMAGASTGDIATARAARAQVGQGSPNPEPLDLALLDALIAAASDPVDPAVARGLSAVEVGTEGQAKTRIAGALALLGGFIPLGPQARFDVADVDLGSGLAPPRRLLALEQSAEQGRMGDAALYILGTAVEAGPHGPSPGERALMVRALRQVHLDADARALAIEGLVAIQAHP